MQKVINFPSEADERNREADRIWNWPKRYQRSPINDEADLLQRMDDIATFLRATIVSCLIAKVAAPLENKALLDAILDIQEYLPDRLSHAIVLDTTFPEVAAQIPKYPK